MMVDNRQQALGTSPKLELAVYVLNVLLLSVCPLAKGIGIVLMLAVVAGPAPREIAAQPAKKIPRIALLRVDSPPRIPVDDFRQTLRELGYIEGENLVLEIRWAESKLERLQQLAQELVGLNVDVIVTHGPQGVRAVKNATDTIPIVIGRIDDVDMHGFVKNLARPESNITGLSFQTGDLSGKCLELLKETIPKLSRVAALWDATSNPEQLKAIETSARTLNVNPKVLEVRDVATFPRAFEAAVKAQNQGLIILGSPLLTFNVARLAKLSMKHRMPAIYTNTTFATAGGLMAYGPDEADPAWSWRRVAVYVDKILKGAKPAELPVEQPTKFDLVINLNTARHGLAIPTSVLARANRVIR